MQPEADGFCVQYPYRDALHARLALRSATLDAVLAASVVALLQHALAEALVLSRRHRRLEHRGALQRGDRVLQRGILRLPRVLALVQVALDERAPGLDGREIRNDGLVVTVGRVLV